MPPIFIVISIVRVATSLSQIRSSCVISINRFDGHNELHNFVIALSVSQLHSLICTDMYEFISRSLVSVLCEFLPPTLSVGNLFSLRGKKPQESSFHLFLALAFS